MPSLEYITEIRKQLNEVGGTAIDGPEGKKLFIVLSRNIGVEDNGILVAYEGQGAFFFTLDRPLNSFRLISAGFSAKVSSAISDLINSILLMGQDPTIETKVPAGQLQIEDRKRRHE